MSRYIYIAFLLYAQAACVALKSNSESGLRSEDLGNGMSAIATIDFSNESSDLEGLSEIVGDAEVVGLGEAHHTVGGYHRLMARSARYLIEKQGFRELALETPWQLAEELGRFTSTCNQGDSLPAMQRIFPQFSSQELLELFTWIRNWNCSGASDKIRVYGFDTQESQLLWRYDQSTFVYYLPILLTYIQQHTGSADAATLAKLKLCGKTQNSDPPTPVSTSQLELCHEGLAALGQYINQSESQIVQELGRPGYNSLRYAIISLWANAGEAANPGGDNFAIRNGWRDRGMAKMLTTIRRDGGSHKTVVIAHLGHVAKAGEAFMPWAYDPKNLGTLLSEAYGSKYRVIGFLAKSYESQSWHRERDVEPYVPSQGSVEDTMASYVQNQGVILNLAQSNLFPAVDSESREILGLPMGGNIRAHVDALVLIPHAWTMHLVPGVKYTDQ